MIYVKVYRLSYSNKSYGYFDKFSTLQHLTIFQLNICQTTFCSSQYFVTELAKRSMLFLKAQHCTVQHISKFYRQQPGQTGTISRKLLIIFCKYWLLIWNTTLQTTSSYLLICCICVIIPFFPLSRHLVVSD